MAIDTTVEPPIETVLRAEAGPLSADLGALPEGVAAALRAISAADVCELDLTESVLATDGPEGVLRLQVMLRRLDAAGQLERGVRVGGRLMARLRPVGRGRTPRTATLAPSLPIKLSRFVAVRAENGRLIAQAPRSHTEIELAPAAACVLGALADWTTPAEVAGAIEGPGLPVAATGAVLALFADAGLLAPGGPDADLERDAPARAQWTIPDLWLHARSRGPRLGASYGGAYPMAARFPPWPARAEPDPGPSHQLAVPDPRLTARTDLSLSEALERRRSIREHDDTAPLTVEQLGELLHRTARQRGTFIAADGQEAADRPYPSGGAAHELEIYPLVTRCTGLEPGLWHYRADEHQLRLVAKDDPLLGRMVASARASCLMSSDPQVVLVIGARFGRVMWKYDVIAYSLVLKHVGVYMQTVYLVATAMGLAVCGVGGGDATDFAAVTGLDYYAQGSVGEIVVGSRAAIPGGTVRLPGVGG